MLAWSGRSNAQHFVYLILYFGIITSIITFFVTETILTVREHSYHGISLMHRQECVLHLEPNIVKMVASLQLACQ